MNGLNVTLALNKDCNVIASFTYPETDITDHAIVEFLIKNELDSAEDKTLYQHCKEIEDVDDEELSVSQVITLPKDGTYTYYRILLPKLEHFLNGSTYEVANKYFVYNNEVYRVDSDIVAAPSDDYIVDDYLQIWEDRDTLFGQLAYVNERFFSFCKLNNCLTNMQWKLIKDFVKNGCTMECVSYVNDRLLRDFILATVYCLRYLAEQGRLEDAQAILDALSVCGKSICPDDSEFEGGCGCGGSI